MNRDLSKLLPPNHPMYSDAVEALRRYHQAQAEGVVGVDLERLRLIAEQQFQAVCSGLMKPDTHLGENARHREVSDDRATSYLYP